MPGLNTASVSMAVTPTVVSTLFSHYLNRRPLKQRPTAHLSYDEGLHLIRSFLDFASHHTVEELQAFTSQWVPHPQWVKVKTVTVPEETLRRAAELLQEQLGQDGIRQVGGRKWWQWRRPSTSLDAEWIEMKSDANERKRTARSVTRVMMYIHGGAYFFGSVDEHRYQMQRHARKLKARVFAPKYRLAPQFPFPCGLHDCLAAYLYLLSQQDPSTIVVAGDSAGGGMVLALLCLLRDQGIPLPAGGILISPWVDLTHSFPSVSGQAPLDYIPSSGFHHKPSRAWPPPNEDDIVMLRSEATKKRQSDSNNSPTTSELKEKQQTAVAPKSEDSSQDAPSSPGISGGIVADPDKFLSVSIDGEKVTIKDQIQMYAPNILLSHPLVSPVMQPTLGGLPPLLIMVGGGEILRDEQIYMAHKCANPSKYSPPPETLTDAGKERLAKYKPTDVQLQVWDDLCHVGPTLSFTRPAKYMYRSVAQFGAWALARAQKTGIEIMDDDNISIISSSDTDDAEVNETPEETERTGGRKANSISPGQVGKAGDPLPNFKNHMIRQRVTRHGVTFPLVPEADLPGCCVAMDEVGIIKEGPSKKWLATKRQWDSRYAGAKAKIHKKIINDMAVGLQEFGPGEYPPPSALAGRRRMDTDLVTQKKRKSVALALWSLWGSKHDELVVEREQRAEQEPETHAITPEEGRGARTFSDIESQDVPPVAGSRSRSRSRLRTVVDENQTGSVVIDENTPIAKLLEERRHNAADHNLLSPDYIPDTGVAGKRPYLGGISSPFSLNKEAETASMVTLHSGISPPSSRALSPMSGDENRQDSGIQIDHTVDKTMQEVTGPTLSRPQLESFVTAYELPKEKDRNESGALS